MYFPKIHPVNKKNDILYDIIIHNEEGKSIYGMGAPVKGNTLLNYFDVGPELIEFLVEKNELRQGLFSPGKNIPVVMESEITEHPDVYYVLAWNFKKEILNKYDEQVKSGVEFYFPIMGD